MRLPFLIRHRWTAAALFIVAGLAGLWTLRAPHVVTLTQDEIQRRLDQQIGRELPVKGAVQLVIESLRVKAAQIVLARGAATVDMDVEGVLRNGRAFEIAATARGLPQYADGAIYFEPERVEIVKLTYGGAGAGELADRLARAPGLGEKARQFILERGRKADDWARATAEAAVRRFLEERPVYRLKDDVKGAAIRSALEKIDVEDGRVTATISLWRLTATTIAGALSFLIGVILAMLALRMILLGESLEIAEG